MNGDVDIVIRRDGSDLVELLQSWQVMVFAFDFYILVGYLATAFGNGKDGIRTTIKGAWCFLLSFVVVCQQ